MLNPICIPNLSAACLHDPRVHSFHISLRRKTEGRLSRTAARKAIDISPRAKGRADGWPSSRTWAARIAVFAAIVLIPMTAVLAYNSMNKPEEEQAQKQQPSEGGRTNVASTDNNTSSAQVVPVNQEPVFPSIN